MSLSPLGGPTTNRHAHFTDKLKPGERAAYAHFLRLVDKDGTGVITGQQVVSLFQKSGLPPQTLSAVCVSLYLSFFFVERRRCSVMPLSGA
jgi:hypothetical protein